MLVSINRLTPSKALSPSKVSIVVVLIRIVGVFCQAVMIMLLANTLSLTDMGTFSAIYVFWGLVRMLGPMGLDQIGMREITRARISGNSPLAAGIASYTAYVASVVGAAIGIGAVAVLVLIGAAKQLSWLSMLLIAAVAPAYSLAGLLAAAVRYYDKPIAAQAIEAIGHHLLFLLLITIHWLLFGLTLESVLVWQAAATVVLAVIYAVMVQKARGNEIARLDVKARADLRRESFDAWQALVLIGLAVRAPIFLSLALLGPAATAILEIALRFGTLPTIVTSAVSMTFAPTMASQHAKHDREGLADTLALSSWLAFVPAACTLLVVSLLGHWLLATFLPPEYEYAYLPLLLVIASTTIHGAFGMSHTLLFMTGHQRVVRYFSVLQLAAVVALGFVLALILGVNGIALALLFSSVVFDVGLARQLQPLLNVTGILRPEGLRTLWHTLKGAPLPAGREELH